MSPASEGEGRDLEECRQASVDALLGLPWVLLLLLLLQLLLWTLFVWMAT